MSNYIFPDGNYGEALHAVYDEINRAKAKHGPKNFNGAHEGFAILKEEVDEMWDDVKKDNLEDAVIEAIQVAAMAVRFAAELGKYPFKKSTKPNPHQKAIEAFKELHPAASENLMRRFEEALKR